MNIEVVLVNLQLYFYFFLEKRRSRENELCGIMEEATTRCLGRVTLEDQLILHKKCKTSEKSVTVESCEIPKTEYIVAQPTICHLLSKETVVDLGKKIYFLFIFIVSVMPMAN